MLLGIQTPQALYSTEPDVDYFRNEKQKNRQIVRRRHDGLEFENGYNNAHWLQMVAFFLSQKKKLEKNTNSMLKKKNHRHCTEPPW